jgi:hypothetical protein
VRGLRPARDPLTFRLPHPPFTSAILIGHEPPGGYPDFTSDDVPERVNMSPEDWRALEISHRELIGRRAYADYTEVTGGGRR